jgi:DNA-binding transcriptional MerR regulator
MEKSYYLIAETSKLVGESQPTLRFWETEFAKHLKVKRNDKGTRFYTKENINIIKNIKYLLRGKNLKIEEAKKHLTVKYSETDKLCSVTEYLENIKAELKAIRRELNEIEGFAETIVIN